MAYVVGTIEVVGGIMLIIGLLTRYISIVFIIILLGAIFTAKLSAGLMGNGQMAGYELDIAYIVIALYLAVANTRSWSVDGLLFKKSSTNR